MTKTELLSTYTAEQLAEMVVELKIQKTGDNYTMFLQSKLADTEAEIEYREDKINKLVCEVEKYRKAFDNAKKERDCQIAEYQKKIDELTSENAELHCELQAVNAFQEGYPTEPIKIADTLINATYTREKGDMEKVFHKAFGNDSDTVEEDVFDISELRQIAEHLLVYCNHNGEAEK